jgi:response regulator RpfG family c-di-GMP phosphodiesterase
VPHATPDPHSPKARTITDLLLRDNLLKAEQIEQAAARMQWSGERVEEAILELGFVTEPELLKSLASHYKVHFISAEKLAKAEVSRALVTMIPQRFADQIGVCPVAFDAKAHALSVVTADPDDLEALHEVQLASGAREVKAVLARPAAVKALIAKVYGGDARAFGVFDRSAGVQVGSTYDRGDLVVDRLRPAESKKSPGGDVPSVGRLAASAPVRVLELHSRYPLAPSALAPPAPAPQAPVPRAPAARATVPETLRPPAAAAPVPNERGVSEASFVELLHVLVSLLESARTDLQGHSAQVARLMRRMAEKMGLDAGTTAIVVAAAFIHDLGKVGPYHLTPFNCSEYDGHKAAAQKACDVPARLLEPVHLPAEVIDAVAHMYERFDGKGFPTGSSGKEIPLGARLLAICDTFADLTSNPRNPFRKTLSPPDACAVLAEYKDRIFDPNLVDLFKKMILGEELTSRLLASRARSLVVDTDPEETIVLELRMSEQGFVVKTARTAEQALKVLAEGETDLVVSEIDLGDSDGLALIAEARSHPWGKDVPWVVYTRRQERAMAQRAFELGVLDYVTKPASADVLVAKLKALLDQRATTRSQPGVSGSLREMSLPDMVQVLFHGRKSGSLKIRAREGRGGEIHFADGNVVDAFWGETRGQDAFFAMLKVVDGEFSLDPSFRASGRMIHQSSEALLLEGMRRLDEGLT